MNLLDLRYLLFIIFIGITNVSFGFQITPNDTLFNSNWGLNNTTQNAGTAGFDIDAPEAWTHTTSCTSSVIAFIDSGYFPYMHEDIGDNLWQNLGEDVDNDGHVIEWDAASGAWVFDPGDKNGIDDDGNGYADDFVGWNFRDNKNNSVSITHGMQTSLISCAKGNNNKGLTGVCWDAQVMLLSYGDEKDSDIIAEAIRYAVDNGARVSNYSFVMGSYNAAFEDAINYAEQNDHLIVAAAGNSISDRDSIPKYPCSFPNDNVICVNQMDSDGQFYSSAYGLESVDITAPGKDIITAFSASSFGFESGTSLAAPFVVGAAALLWELYPNLSASEIKESILNSAEPNPDLIERNKTGGYLNINNAINYVYNQQLSCRQRDSLTLVSLYEYTDGANWTNSWDLDAPMDTWFGLTLNSSGCARQLKIVQNNLTGSLPPNLGDLSELSSLEITHNPNLKGIIPESIVDLTNLFVLSFAANDLTGPIPEEIGNISNLFRLFLFSNNLTGSLPASLGDMQNLQIMAVANNQLEGCYPSNLISICSQLTSSHNSDASVSNGNNLDAPWTDFCSSFAGCCSGDCPTSIGINDYKLCGSMYVQETVSGGGKLSGLTYNPFNGLLYMSNSTPEKIWELDKAGKLLRVFELQGFTDTEAITFIDAETMVIAEEAFVGNIVFVDFPTADQTVITIPYPAQSEIIHIPSMASNSGIEGMTYDAKNDLLYYVKEKDEAGVEMALHVLENPLSYKGQTINTPIDALDIKASLAAAQLDNYTDLTGLSMTSSGTILIASENGRGLVELNPLTGEIYGDVDAHPTHGTRPQSVTIDDEGNLYAADHSQRFIMIYRKECLSCGDCNAQAVSLPYFEDFEDSHKVCYDENAQTLFWPRHADEVGENVNNGLKNDTYVIAPRQRFNTNFPLQFIVSCLAIPHDTLNPFLSFDYGLQGSTNFIVEVKEPTSNQWILLNIGDNPLFGNWRNSGNIDLSAYSESVISLRFTSYEDQSNSTKTMVDNIIVSADGLTIPDSHDCPTNLMLSGNDSSNDYEASETIQSTQMIDGTDVSYQAGEVISLDIGFEVTATTTFSVEIEGCN